MPFKLSQIGLDSVKNTLKCRFIANIVVILSQISYLIDPQSNKEPLICVASWFLQIYLSLLTLSTICIEWETSWWHIPYSMIHMAMIMMTATHSWSWLTILNAYEKTIFTFNLSLRLEWERNSHTPMTK